MFLSSAGINTGSYYAIGTLLNPIILYYFEVSTNVFRSFI